jgi:hypothetical protein
MLNSISGVKEVSLMKKLFCAVICAISIGIQMFLLTPDGFSQEFGYEFNNVIYEQPAYYQIKKNNLLNARNDILNLDEWNNKLWDKINLNFYYDILRLNTQFRPTLFFSEWDSNKTHFYTDEIYLDAHFGKSLFLYAGKRNFVEGVAFGLHPTDFLGQFKKVDLALREEERRVQREGNWLVGGDTFFKNITFSAIYAPHLGTFQDEQNRVLLKGRALFEPINTDVALYLYYGDIPGLGMDVSSTVSKNLVLFTESALRRGSQRWTITQTSMATDTAPAMFKFNPPDKDKVYAQAVVGGSYTFGDGTNLILEYIYNGDGYSGSGWNQFTDYARYYNGAYNSNYFRDLAEVSLGRGTSILQFGEMRKNYAFLRLSNNTSITDLDGQLVVTANLNDGSWLGYLSIDYSITKSLIAGIYGMVTFGKKDTEYGMQYANTVGLLIRYFFTIPNVFKSTEKKQARLNEQQSGVPKTNGKEMK